MSKRNFILLVIVIFIIVAIIFGFLYLRPSSTPTIDNTGGSNFISNFNPFGNNGTTPPNTTPTTGTTPNTPPDTTTPVANLPLKKVSTVPVAGFIVYDKERLKDVPVITPATPDTTTPTNTTTTPTPKKTTTTKPTPPLTETVPSVRYVDRITGNIYQTFADDIVERQFSTTLIPKVYEAFFGNGGQSVVLRYLKTDNKTIETFVGNLPKEYLGADTTPDVQITGTFLPEDIKDVSVSPDTSSIFYLFNSDNNTIGTTLNLATNKKVQIFSSAFNEWLSLWPNSKMLTVTTKPSSGIPGYVYSMDSTGKNLSKIFGGINGLTTLASPNGKSILYGNDNLALSVYNTTTKTSTTLGVKTLPEKCVWSAGSDVVYCAVPKSIPGAQYPDAWYQGEVSFSDEFWKIDTTTGNATLLLDPATIPGGEDVDGIKLALDTNENYLFFVNKKDSFLWEITLN